jgi:hypothetical protein
MITELPTADQKSGSGLKPKVGVGVGDGVGEPRYNPSCQLRICRNRRAEENRDKREEGSTQVCFKLLGRLDHITIMREMFGASAGRRNKRTNEL